MITPYDQLQLITELKRLIKVALDDCCNKENLPKLKAQINTPEGMESAKLILFEMCSRDGISIQTAMSTIEMEYGHELFNSGEDEESDI